MAITDLLIEPVEIAPLKLSEDCEPWERQHGESDAEWTAFAIFRNMLPSERKMIDCARIVTGNPDLSQTPSRYSAMAKKNRWGERILAYDRWYDNNVRERLEEYELNRRLAAANLAETIYKKLNEVVSAIQAVVEVKEVDAEGNVVSALVKPNLSVQAITHLSNVAVNLEKVTSGSSIGDASGLHIHGNALFQVGDNQLIQQATKVVERQREIIDAIPFEIIRPGSDDASSDASAGRADVD